MTVYPGIDMSYKIENWKLFASYNTSLRLPSFTEMYYKLQGYAADPHLKPEEMQAVEVGAQWTSPALQAKVTAYHHHGKNMIDWIMDSSLGTAAQWQSVNHTEINAYGIEAAVAAQTPWARLNLSYSYIHQDKQQEEHIVSQYALEYLRHKLIASVQTKEWQGLSLRVDARWQDRVGSYISFDGTVCDYQPYVLFNARLQWTRASFTVYADANNILDNRSYVDFGNVPQPGVWAVVGTKYRF